MMAFKSSYSKSMIWLTIIISLIVIVPVGVLVFVIADGIEKPYQYAILGIVVIFLLAILIGCYVMQLQSISVTKDDICLHRGLSNIMIPRSEIEEVRVDKGLPSGIRIFGVGGLFGYSGWFSNKELGKYYALVKDKNAVLVIKTHTKCFVVSCDDCAKLQELLQAKNKDIASTKEL